MKEKLQWGVVGTGGIATDFANALSKSKRCRIVNVTGLTPELSRAYADKWRIPATAASLDELLADKEVEAVYIGTPHPFHEKMTMAAIAAGKPVLCEKPIALDAKEAEQLVAARNRTGKLITEAFMVRSHPQWLRARELVRQGKIGDLRAVQGLFTYFLTDPENVRNKADIGGGGLYDIGCYPIVTSRFVFGAEPTRVVGLIERDPVLKIDRLASAILDFPSGQASFMCSTQLVPYQRMQILGTKGRIEVEIPFNAPPDKPCRIFVDDGSALGDASAKEEAFPVCDQYCIQGDLFSEAIRSGKPPEFPLENAVQNMRIIDAIFRSAKAGGWEKV
jgi:predicted dehydrogenase